MINAIKDVKQDEVFEMVAGVCVCVVFARMHMSRKPHFEEMILLLLSAAE